MSLPLTLLIGFAAGADVALSASRALKRQPERLRSRYLAVAALLGAVMAPAGLVLYLLFPDWTLMYLANPAHLSAVLMVPLLFLLYGAAPVLGYLVARQLVVKERFKAVRSVTIAVLVLVAALIAGGFQRLTTVAYYDHFYYGEGGVALTQSTLLLPLLLVAGAITSVVVATNMHLRRHLALIEKLPGR